MIFSGFRTWTRQNQLFACFTNVFVAFCFQKRTRFSHFGLFCKGFDEPKCGFDHQYLGQSARSWKDFSCSRGVGEFFGRFSEDFFEKTFRPHWGPEDLSRISHFGPNIEGQNRILVRQTPLNSLSCARVGPLFGGRTLQNGGCHNKNVIWRVQLRIS